MERILGNEEIKEHFRTAVRHRMISHAYLIEGEKGSGKKLIADAFARILQCESPVQTPEGPAACGRCTSCLMMDHEDHPDVVRVTHESPAVIRVDDVREQLVNTVDVMPYRGPYKIYIIDEAEKMNVPAQNVVLKTIEEPPGYAVILLLAAGQGALLPTVLSRCVRMHMKAVPDDLVREYVKRECGATEETAQFCTGFAMGNIGKARDAAVSEEFGALRDWGLSLLRELPELTDYEIMGRVRDLKQWPGRTGDYLDMMRIWFRDLLIWKALEDENRLILKSELLSLGSQGKKLPFEAIHNIMQSIDHTGRALLANVNQDTLMEVLHIGIKNRYRV